MAELLKKTLTRGFFSSRERQLQRIGFYEVSLWSLLKRIAKQYSVKKRVCCCALLALAVLTLPTSGMAASSPPFTTKGFRYAKLMSRAKEGDHCARLYVARLHRDATWATISKGAAV